MPMKLDSKMFDYLQILSQIWKVLRVSFANQCWQEIPAPADPGKKYSSSLKVSTGEGKQLVSAVKRIDYFIIYLESTLNFRSYNPTKQLRKLSSAFE